MICLFVHSPSSCNNRSSADLKPGPKALGHPLLLSTGRELDGSDVTGTWSSARMESRWMQGKGLATRLPHQDHSSISKPSWNGSPRPRHPLITYGEENVVDAIASWWPTGILTILKKLLDTIKNWGFWRRDSSPIVQLIDNCIGR